MVEKSLSNLNNRDYDPNRKWIIEVTEQQLIDIINDVEDIHRFLAGQTELYNVTNYVNSCKNKLRDKLRDLQPLVTPQLSYNESYDWCGSGCPDEAQKEKIKRGYAIYRNLRHCIEKFRNRDSWNVYQNETLTCGVPLAVCYPKINEERVEEAADFYSDWHGDSEPDSYEDFTAGARWALSHLWRSVEKDGLPKPKDYQTEFISTVNSDKPTIFVFEPFLLYITYKDGSHDYCLANFKVLPDGNIEWLYDSEYINSNTEEFTVTHWIPISELKNEKKN